MGARWGNVKRLWLVLATAALGCHARSAPPPVVVVAETAPAPAPTAMAAHATPAPDAGTAPDAASGDECSGPGDATKKTDLTCADRKAWFAVLHWPESCEDDYDASPLHGMPALSFHAIGPKRWVVQIDCILGAYQGYAVFMLRDESTSPPTDELLRFRTYEAPEERKLVRKVTAEVWGIAEWHDDTKELVVFDRYRGPGDCGALVTYSLASGHPRVKEFRSKNVCDGQGAEDPSKWPKIPPP